MAIVRANVVSNDSYMIAIIRTNLLSLELITIAIVMITMPFEKNGVSQHTARYDSLLSLEQIGYRRTDRTDL